MLPAGSWRRAPGGTRGSPASSEAKPWCSKLVGTKGEGTGKSMVEVQQPRRCECSSAVVPDSRKLAEVRRLAHCRGFLLPNEAKCLT